MLELHRPSMDLASRYFDFVDEMRSVGETVWEGLVPFPGESTPDFVERLKNAEFTAPPGRVTETTYWALMNNQVVGRISLRHALNSNLEEFGGHIGYEVRPSSRRQGVAKKMLRDLLATPKAREIGKLLLTCAPDNIASNRTILANGGVLTKTAYVEKWKRQTNYYWIDLMRRA